jgi:hypothetical protein
MLHQHSRLLNGRTLDRLQILASYVFGVGLHYQQVKVKFTVTFRQTISQSSVLVSGTRLGPATNFSISLRFSFRQLLFVML